MISRIIRSASVGACIAAYALSTPLAAQVRPSNTLPKDSIPFRVDPIIVLENDRLTRQTLVSLKKTDTMQVEIVRGSDALRFGLDADGGVMRIKRAKPASAAAADAQKRPSDVGDGSNNGMSDNTGFGTGGGTRMGGGMGGIGGMGGMNRSSMSGASNAQIPIGIATKNSIYPIVFIGSRRVTDDSLYKYKPDMLAFVEIMDSTAAVAAYGDKGAGGAVIFTPIKVPEPAKKKKK